jgi:sugar phosphate isomerase/epimerase
VVSAGRGRERGVHSKDVSASTAQGRTVEIGRGVIDIPILLRTLKRINFSGTLALEYEKDEKDEKDPLAGAAESIGYLRGVLATMA